MSIKNAKNKQVDGSETANKDTTPETGVDEGKIYTYPESGFTIKAKSRAEADKAYKKHIGQSEDK